MDLGIRQGLHPIEDGDNILLPAACYAFSPQEKLKVCTFLSNLKVPDAFSSNISRCVNIQERKIYGLKSHDYHVLLQEIFPVAIRGVLSKEVCEPIIALVHLANEAKLGGPVQYRWMYPIERFMGKFKAYIRNKNHPVGSIAESHLACESITFCSRYLKNIPTKFNRPSRNDDESVSNGEMSIFKGRTNGGSNAVTLSHDEFKQACMYVLQNCEEV